MLKPSNVSQPPEFRWLDIYDFEYLCFNLTVRLMSIYEPIPEFSSVNLELLKSALGNPQQGIAGGLLYPTLEKQVAILFYSLIKNHPFKNGNKRIAVMTILAHTIINHKWITIDPIQLYDLACAVAKSPPKQKDKIMKRIEKEVKNNIIDIPDNM